jgi:phospholipid/cholesterol/gamma-HCH transport system substrate-binding protein
MSRQARLGLLVLCGVLLFVTALFIIANRSFLLSPTYTFFVEFNRIGGLVPGNDVQYHGMSIGRVEDIALPQTPGAPIRVMLAVEDDARHLVRHGGAVHIAREGMIGEPMVLLSVGNGSVVESGAVLAGSDPLDLMDLTDKALNSVALFDSVAVALYDIASTIRQGQGTIGRMLNDPTAYESLLRTATEADQMLDFLAQQADTLTASVLETTVGVQAILEKINNGQGTIAQLLNDRQIYDEMLMLSRQAQDLTSDLNRIVTQADQVVQWGNLAAFRAAENMEALKHNWLFKGYFERRGYYEQAPFEIREQALAESFQALEDKQQALYQWEQRLNELEARLSLVSDSLSRIDTTNTTPPGNTTRSNRDNP